MAGWTLAWTAANLSWLGVDQLVRDGDEEGHVGAAELFLHDLSGDGLGAFLDRLWRQDMGDYPSLYPALEGAWWWLLGGGDPGRPAIRALGLLWVLLTAAAVGGLGRRVDARTGVIAFVAATLLPLPVGLARHFMPEGLLVAAVALAVLAAVRLAEAPSLGRGLVLGLALGTGFLVKQTFLLLAPVPVLATFLLWRRLPLLPLLGTVLTAALVAGPWSLAHLQAQLAYGLASASSAGARGLPGLLFYPVAGVLLVVGPVLTVAALPGLAALRSPVRRRLAGLALAWLLGGMLLLTLVPKKYPRLLAPVAPAAALLAGLGLGATRRSGAWGLGLAATGGAWLAWRSLSPPAPLPTPIQAVVPGCPQHWLRPPFPDDLGFAAVAEAVRQTPPGPVRVLDAPVIPCQIQTTPSWAQHLSPYLRRVGEDRDLLLGEDSALAAGQPAVLELRWVAGAVPAGEEDSIPVQALGGRFRLSRP